MDGSGEGTFLEDFVQSVELLPNDVRRNFELMRELDRDSTELTRECADLGNQYLRELRDHMQKRPNESLNQSALNEYRPKKARAEQNIHEKIAIAEQTLEIVESVMRELDHKLEAFETVLKGAGDFEAAVVEPGREVAVRPDAFENEWILGRVIKYHNDTGFYDILDADEEETYSLPEAQVVLLDPPDGPFKRLSKGEEVFAVYPDTTAFYHASIVQVPKRTSSMADATAVVQFLGDANELGQTPNRTVKIRHIIKMPASV